MFSIHKLFFIPNLPWLPSSATGLENNQQFYTFLTAQPYPFMDGSLGKEDAFLSLTSAVRNGPKKVHCAALLPELRTAHRVGAISFHTCSTSGQARVSLPWTLGWAILKVNRWLTSHFWWRKASRVEYIFLKNTQPKFCVQFLVKPTSSIFHRLFTNLQISDATTYIVCYLHYFFQWLSLWLQHATIMLGRTEIS
jgi:hypothetical protein